jgi:hypothetical protein
VDASALRSLVRPPRNGYIVSRTESTNAVL